MKLHVLSDRPRRETSTVELVVTPYEFALVLGSLAELLREYLAGGVDGQPREIITPAGDILRVCISQRPKDHEKEV